MSKMVEINLKPDEKILRQFGFIALVGFGFLAGIAHFELLIFSFGLGDAKEGVTFAFLGIAAASTLFSLVYPKANLPIYLGLTVISYPIGFVLSYVIMGTLFYLLITPVGLFFKLTGRDSMNRRWEPEAATYWADPRPRRENESYFRQF